MVRPIRGNDGRGSDRDKERLKIERSLDRQGGAGGADGTPDDDDQLTVISRSGNLRGLIYRSRIYTHCVDSDSIET